MSAADTSGSFYYNGHELLARPTARTKISKRIHLFSVEIARTNIAPATVRRVCAYAVHDRNPAAASALRSYASNNSRKSRGGWSTERSARKQAHDSILFSVVLPTRRSRGLAKAKSVGRMRPQVGEAHVTYREGKGMGHLAVHRRMLTDEVWPVE